MIPDIECQIEAMRRDWPAWQVVARAGECATWRGPLRPTSVAYDVEVHYRVPLVVENRTVRDVQPHVTVDALAPWLLHPSANELHLCWSLAGDRSPPTLCLFDPHVHPCQWSVEDLIAETILPWTCEWLLFFEGWLVTGTWEGGEHQKPGGADLRS